MKSRRYRNRRLGDYLKELRVSEGRATGIPTIQDELRKNGYELAKIETDEDRTYFLIEIPCREGFEKSIEPLNGTVNGTISERERNILNIIAAQPEIKKTFLAERLNLSVRTISRSLQILMNDALPLIEYQGSKRTGGYVLTEKGKLYIKTFNKE